MSSRHGAEEQRLPFAHWPMWKWTLEVATASRGRAPAASEQVCAAAAGGGWGGNPWPKVGVGPWWDCSNGCLDICGWELFRERVYLDVHPESHKLRHFRPCVFYS